MLAIILNNKVFGTLNRRHRKFALNGWLPGCVCGTHGTMKNSSELKLNNSIKRLKNRFNFQSQSRQSNNEQNGSGDISHKLTHFISSVNFVIFRSLRYCYCRQLAKQPKYANAFEYLTTKLRRFAIHRHRRDDILLLIHIMHAMCE